MKVRNKFWSKTALLLAITALLSACIYTKPQKGNPAISDMNKSLQAAYIIDKNIARKQRTHSSYLTANLAPDFMSPLGKAEKSEQRFDVTANDVPAKDFFMGLVKDTSYNMVVSPKIEGVITLNLKQVTIPEVLQAAKDNYGYQFKRTLYGYEIHPPCLESRTFTINYLDMNRHGKSSMSVSSGQITQKTSNNASIGTGGAIQGGTGADVTKNVTAVSSVETTSKSDFWKQLLDSLKAIVGDKAGREVVINPASGMVFVRAYPDELDAVGKYLDSMQATMTRQVIIEAKVMEVTLNDEYQAGINWKALGVQQNGLQSFNDNLPNLTITNSSGAVTGAGGIFTIAAQSHNAFNSLISLLSTQGNVQVLSSPRIATLNNQKAIIKVGQDEFFITNVVNTTVTGTSTQNSQNVELTPFFSGISLDVTPEIDQNDKVILHIHPMISKVTQKNLTYTIGGNTANNNTNNSLPLATSSIRESDNVVSAENGQIVVIGGLMTNKTQENTASTPGLSKAPVVGSLFRRNHQVSEKAELVILLRPIVVGNNTWAKEMHEEARRLHNVDRGFHYGTSPEIFGNKAEQNIKTR